MSVEVVSMTKTAAYCYYSFDFNQPGAEVMDEEAVAEYKRKLPRDVRSEFDHTGEIHRLHVQHFREISKTYSELCQIVRVLELLTDWREEEQKLIQSVCPCPVISKEFDSYSIIRTAG